MPFFGKHYLNEIAPKLVADYKTQRRRDRYQKGKRARPVSVATINRELCCLKVLFRKAVEWGRLTENPTSSVKVFKETPEAPRLLEEGEISRLLQAMSEHHQALVACAVYAGLRRSELFHLRWEDIDRKAGQGHRSAHRAEVDGASGSEDDAALCPRHTGPRKGRH